MFLLFVMDASSTHVLEDSCDGSPQCCVCGLCQAAVSAFK